jgi:hypothetical protein
MTKARDIADFKFENIVDTGTEGTKVASGTTAQRGSTTGQWRYNTTTGFFEGRNSSGNFSTLEPIATISSVDVTEVDSQAGGNATFVITGTNFSSGGTVFFVGSSGTDITASTTTFNSATQVTAVAPKSSFNNNNEPYKIKFTSSGGVDGQSASGLISVDTSPTWSTASGTVATISDVATGNHVTISATDPDGDTVTYAETGGTNITGAGLSLSSAGVISGDPTNVGSSTTVSFTARATANSKTTDRAFNIIINPALDGTSSGRAISNISTFNSLGSLTTGYHDRYVTLNGAVSAYQQKVYYDGTDTWYVLSPVFSTGGMINSSSFGYNQTSTNGCFKAIVGGQSAGHDRRVSGSGTWSYLSNVDVATLIGTTLNITDTQGAVPTGHSNGSVATLSANTLSSYATVNYYDHIAGSNFASGTVTALRNVITELNPKTAWLTITGDDDGGDYSASTASNVNWRSNATIWSTVGAGTPGTSYFKNSAGNNFKLMGGQTSANEHMGVSLLTHNEGLFMDSNASSPTHTFGGTPAFTGGMASGSGYSLGIMPTQYAGEVGGSCTTFTSPLHNSTIGKLNSRLVLLYK